MGVTLSNVSHALVSIIKLSFSRNETNIAGETKGGRLPVSTRIIRLVETKRGRNLLQYHRLGLGEIELIVLVIFTSEI